MEFGPRALGNRSIIADPRSEKMQSDLNLKIKFRESFRPFAPSVLHEKTNEWFDTNLSSPYMLFIAELNKNKILLNKKKINKFKGLNKLNKKISIVPAITHVDHTARLQTVTKKNNKFFYLLISKFYEYTGCPMVINTSFNIRGEPIVMTPQDAYKCFLKTNLDILVLENFIISKKN